MGDGGMRRGRIGAEGFDIGAWVANFGNNKFQDERMGKRNIGLL